MVYVAEESCSLLTMCSEHLSKIAMRDKKLQSIKATISALHIDRGNKYDFQRMFFKQMLWGKKNLRIAQFHNYTNEMQRQNIDNFQTRLKFRCNIRLLKNSGFHTS